MAGKGKAAVKDLGDNLIRIAQKGDLEAIKELLDSETDIEFKVAAINFREQKAGVFALLAAGMGGFQDTMEYLLQQGANINLMDRAGETTLIKVADRGLLNIITFLVDRGAEINKASAVENITALMKASKKGHTAVVQYLLDHEAEVDVVDKSGWTALIYAAHAGHTDIIRSLLTRQVNLDYVDEEAGWTALMYASRYGHTETVELLLQAGAQLEVIDRKRNTALLLACNNRHWTTADLLISRGVDINAMSDMGDTALMLACLRGSMSTVTALLAKGADTTLTNKKGQNAMEFAKQSDIKRAITEWEKEQSEAKKRKASTEVVAAEVVTVQEEVVPAAPQDLVHQDVLQKVIADSSETALLAIAQDLAANVSTMNASIENTQADFVSFISSMINNSNNNSMTTNIIVASTPLSETDQQIAVKYHALLLRLWHEIVTVTQFYHRHSASLAQTLLVSTNHNDPTTLKYTENSRSLWSIHFALMTMVANKGAESPAELSLSQLLTLFLLLNIPTQNGATINDHEYDISQDSVVEWLARWSSLTSNASTVVVSLLKQMAVRRAVTSTWTQDSVLAPSLSLTKVIPHVQTQRKSLATRFSSADTNVYLSEQLPKIETDEQEKLSNNQQTYVSVYEDMFRVLTTLFHQVEDNVVISPIALVDEEVMETLVVKMTNGLQKPKPVVPPPPPPPSVPVPTSPVTRTKVISTDDHTQNPLLQHQGNYVEDEGEEKVVEKKPVDKKSSVNEAEKAKPTPTPAATKPAPAPAPAPPAKVEKPASKCCCVIS